ncbi:hypothetical protein PF010_g15701 [Phytophthora fragariae]|uniref:Uncharacterized protein n=2 Tax=Phytophthora fragariae TaxID=53985 RepID=A0A6A3KB98_9STRA|nr:hypothetical protein PF003_g33354 [Phytophthora fragariae]KAE9004459.1 hypothetical protein PF011_g12433 [Phytophthora fragariae]KAE9098107.1 hypothetical protein PF010_g15701 [Phytophthora fragariae]KAE9249503.1 hypothetical protein PF002_g5274 [Phytophthora fragariae]KAE9268828.1 hypothetical protein PF001_g29494 [Phytophthora fragariae]
MPGSSTKRQRASPGSSSCAELAIKRRRTASETPESSVYPQTLCDQDAVRDAVPDKVGGPRTRSSRAPVPPKVNESVTIQVTPLAEFRLSPPSLASSPSRSCPSAASSQRTVTDPSPSASPEATTTTSTLRVSPSPPRSQPSTTAPWSPGSTYVAVRHDQEEGGASSVTSSPVSTVAASSQTSTVAPWSPQSPFNSRRRVRTVVVPLWFAEVFESDSYDSEALEIIGSPAPPRREPANPTPSSSPGFAVVGAPPPLDRMAGWRLEP